MTKFYGEYGTELGLGPINPVKYAGQTKQKQTETCCDVMRQNKNNKNMRIAFAER